MARVIYGGNEEFNFLAFGEKNPTTQLYLQQQLESLSPYVTEASRGFVDRSRELYERYNNAEAQRVAMAATRRVQSIFQKDVIRALTSLAELQNASLTMQRWMMAEPDLRERYHRQRVQGFAGAAMGEYVDVQPGLVGNDHYDYRRAMQGFVVETPPEVEGEEPGWCYTTYYDDELHEGDRELTVGEQVEIHSVWDFVRHHLKLGEDPTSPFGTPL